MKTMSYKEFKKSFESLRGFIKHRTFYYHQLEMKFTPAGEGFAIKFPHNFVIVKAYSKGQDATYLYIIDEGVVNFGLSDTDQGVVLKLHGDVSGKRIQKNLLSNRNMLALINDLYKDRINKSIMTMRRKMDMTRKEEDYEYEYESCNM